MGHDVMYIAGHVFNDLGLKYYYNLVEFTIVSLEKILK